MKNNFILILCAIIFWIPEKSHCTEVDFISEGVIYKKETPTNVTKPTKLNIHDDIELQINQATEDKRLEKLHKKAQIKEIKENARKAGFELIIEDDKIIKVLKTH